MDNEQRQSRMDSYGIGYETLIATLRNIPRESWSFRPLPTAWSVHEIVVHLADAEAHGYIRCRMLIAQPGSAVIAYDQDAWAGALDYAKRNTDDALELFRFLRRTTRELIASLPEEAWGRTIEHPERGAMTLDDWLVSYDDHLAGHLHQIERNHAAWIAARQGSFPARALNGSEPAG